MSAAPADRLAAWWVVGAGVVAALQVGKLPPALPVLQAELGLTLVQSGFLLSAVQAAGMGLAVFMGLWADAWGMRRSLLLGLCVLTLASSLGALATSPWMLLAARAAEGFGFLGVVLPAPGLIRRLVPGDRLAGMLGLWGAYMPTGTALALWTGPAWLEQARWPSWWLLFAAVSALMALVIAWRVPPDGPSTRSGPGALSRLGGTLSAPGPWLVALMFGVYSSQWLAVIGFLPTIYAQSGQGGAWLGALTALAAAINMLGNLTGGRLLQAGWPPRRTLWMGYGAMALGSTLAFGPGLPDAPALRYAGVLLFSGGGGWVPATLFTLAVRLAPGESRVATTVGWMQQCSALGQFIGPPLAAWLAARAGGWQVMPAFTLSCCLVGAVLAWATARWQRQQAQSRP